MKPICVPCQRFFKPKKNGFYFLEGMPTEASGDARGKDAPGWLPYKLWVGDLWECEGCGAQIVYGVGRDRIAEHYQPEFNQMVDSLNARQLQVNDC